VSILPSLARYLKIGGPRAKRLDQFPLSGRWKNARKITGDAAAGDVRERGNPAAGDDIFQRG